MGNRPLRTLQDVIRAGLHLEITCPVCGRRAVYAATSYLMYLRENAAAISLGEFERRLRCDRGGVANGCGRKGASVKVIEWPPRGIEPMRPEPKNEVPPVGVNVEAWSRADARERRRLVARARG